MHYLKKIEEFYRTRRNEGLTILAIYANLNSNKERSSRKK